MKFLFKSLLVILLVLNVISFEVSSKSKVHSHSKAHSHSHSKIKSHFRMRAKMHSRTHDKSNHLHNSKNSNSMMSLLGSLTEEKFYSSSRTRKTSLPNKKKLTLEKRKMIEGLWNGTGIIENWLTISSKSFIDRTKFPKIVLPDDKTADIKLDDDLFRINDVWAKNKTSALDTPPCEKCFYFRLSGTHIYYSPTPSDYNVLGAISIRYVETIGPVGKGIQQTGSWCIKVKDTENQLWRLCARDEIVRKQWLCRIQNTLKLPLDASCFSGVTDDEYESGKVEKTIIKPIILIPIPSPVCNEKWDYQRHGDDWQCECKEGKEQTPIRLPPAEKAADSSVKPLFQYDEISLRSSVTTIDGQVTQNNKLQLRLVDGVLKIIHPNLGKLITMDGAIYQAQEIIIHTPAEHKIDSKNYDMELQIIHYGISKGDIAKQVVLSFLFEKKPGSSNRFLDDLDFYNLPNHLNKKVDLTKNININNLFYSTESKEPPVAKSFSFYTYQGSLPFPPCTENTIVYVASKPFKIGSTALALFIETLRIPDFMDQQGNIIVSNWMPHSNRSEQPNNGRPIYHYDHKKYCNVEELPESPKNFGHYEKMVVKHDKYFYVNSQFPSGIPNSYVVSENEAKGYPIHLP
jgi:carbonic anhydrase